MRRGRIAPAYDVTMKKRTVTEMRNDKQCEAAVL